jgi:ribonuclease HI
MSTFSCQSCGLGFAVPEATLAKYPGWQPKQCLRCKKGAAGASGARRSTAPRSAAPRSAAPGRSAASAREEDLTLADVLAKYSAGPLSGVFTDGAVEPNPGPGGWGVVHVVENRIVSEERGHEPHTTSNRMELTALIAACRIVPAGTSATLYTDSQLCVKTCTLWAKGWEARGWRRKDGEIKNLELVQELYGTLKRRPELRLEWIAAHAGNRWNEYADSLATAYRRARI